MQLLKLKDGVLLLITWSVWIHQMCLVIQFSDVSWKYTKGKFNLFFSWINTLLNLITFLFSFIFLLILTHYAIEDNNIHCVYLPVIILFQHEVRENFNCIFGGHFCLYILLLQCEFVGIRAAESGSHVGNVNNDVINC